MVKLFTPPNSVFALMKKGIRGRQFRGRHTDGNIVSQDLIGPAGDADQVGRSRHNIVIDAEGFDKIVKSGFVPKKFGSTRPLVQDVNAIIEFEITADSEQVAGRSGDACQWTDQARRSCDRPGRRREA